MKSKEIYETIWAVSTTITKLNRTEKIIVENDTEITGEFELFPMRKDYKFTLQWVNQWLR